jgi:anti-anti-sigma factor
MAGNGRWTTAAGARLEHEGGLLTTRESDFLMLPGPEFSLAFSRAFGKVVVHIHGSLDSRSAPVLRDRLVDIVDGQGNRQVILDLRSMTAVDVAGLLVVGDAVMRMRECGGELVLSGPTAEVAAQLRPAGLAEAVLMTPEWTHPAGRAVRSKRTEHDSAR